MKNDLIYVVKNLTTDVIDNILGFDGRIYNDHGQYINRIHPHDERYTILDPVILKRIEVITKCTVVDNYHRLRRGAERGTAQHIRSQESWGDKGFYFYFSFEKLPRVGLCYAAGSWSSRAFSMDGKLEICYYDLRKSSFLQERIYL